MENLVPRLPLRVSPPIYLCDLCDVVRDQNRVEDSPLSHQPQGDVSAPRLAMF